MFSSLRSYLDGSGHSREPKKVQESRRVVNNDMSKRQICIISMSKDTEIHEFLIFLLGYFVCFLGYIVFSVYKVVLCDKGILSI